VLLAAALAAFALANSPWRGAHARILDAIVDLSAGAWAFRKPVRFWIDDGLMTIFFFAVGLEIRREMREGELSTARRAALPVVAALGGMIAPALAYLAIAGGDAATRRGWGVPMATDIAFAVGVLALLGRRVPPALRVLLLALAIIDDIGSIVVIAAFYSKKLDLVALVVASAASLSVAGLARAGVRRPVYYLLPALIAWIGALGSGVHPTIAGVAVGLLMPPGDLQERLHPWVAYAIMPLFALANAGVVVSGGAIGEPVALGVAAGLALGKPAGIVAACKLATALKVATLPRGIGARELMVLGIVAGIGFTMALFVAELAFADTAHLESAKLAILLSSCVAGVVGLAAGRLALREVRPAGEARTEAEAEASDEV
jgi:NhaA family Na+:H+ antiporter